MRAFGDNGGKSVNWLLAMYRNRKKIKKNAGQNQIYAVSLFPFEGMEYYKLEGGHEK